MAQADPAPNLHRKSQPDTLSVEQARERSWTLTLAWFPRC